MPSTTTARPQPYRCSAVYRHHLALGATMVAYHGWRAAAQFTSAAEEARQVRRGVGLADVSWLGKLDVRGTETEGLEATLSSAFGASPAAEAGSVRAVPRRAWRLAHAHALVTCGPEETESVARFLERWVESGAAGLPLSPALSPTRGERELVLPPSAIGRPSPADGRRAGGEGTGPPSTCVHVTDVTSVFAALLLVGPQSCEVLHKLTDLDVSPAALPDPAWAQAGLAHVHAIVLRVDIGDLPAYWLLVGREYGEYVWEAVMHAGHEFGIVPCGVAALDVLTPRPVERR